MKKIFRKAITVLGSAALIGMTVGSAMAASYPTPFTSNTAIVVGANAAPSDNIAAASIASNLDASAVGGDVTLTGDESFTLEKTSNKFNYNNALNAVYTDLDEENMDFLADGTYDDGDVDEDYEQKITFGTETLALFADNDYKDDEPTVGFRWTNGQKILDYTITFDEEILYADMDDSDMPLLGKEYYVLTAEADKLEVLDSAEKTIISEGESITVNGRTVSIEFLDADEVKFNVNGEITDKMVDHGYEELDDGAYIVANEIMYSEKESGIGKVEFSIGAGLITLEDTKEVDVNGEDVDGLVVTFTDDADGITALTLTWNSDDETFLTESNPITMPTFDSISLVYGGLDYDSDSEEVSFDNGETLTLGMDNYDLPLMFFAGTGGNACLLGEEDYRLVTKVSTVANYTNPSANLSASLTTGLSLGEDNRFIVTRLDDDLSDAETLYYEVSGIEYDGTDILVELDDLIGDNDLEFDALEDQDRGDITITLEHVNDTQAYFTFAASSGSITFNKAVSDKGLVVTLPAKEAGDTTDLSSAVALTVREANEDEDVNSGAEFTVSIVATTNDKIHASTTNVSTEEISDDKYIGYVASDLASIVTTDQTGDEYDLSIEYFGKEVTADVTLVAGETSTTTTDAGVMTVMDTAVSTVAGKNLVVVGGSAINAVAAELLDGSFSEGAFTTATGVGAGEFLIQSFDRAGTTALLVAGYNAADTEKAVTYLLNNDVDTTVDAKLIGTSATEATVVTA